MAKILRNFNFDGGGEKYPYDEWFDGRIYQLDRGIDFTVHPNSMRINLYNAAERRGLQVQTRILESQETPVSVIVQAYTL